MTFSIFQVNLPFHAVYPYLKLRPPGSPKSPEDWASAETEALALGDMVFLLEPIYSPYGNAKKGIGVSEGDSFRVSNLLLLFRKDAGYPMCISLSTDTYEMQFVEAILTAKADQAKAQGNGFYYLHAAKIPPASTSELAAIAEMHKWGNSAKRLESPKGLAEPGYFFLNSLRTPVEPIYQKQTFDIEMCAYYLFTDNDQNLKGKAPDLGGFYEPVKRPENALAGIDVGGATAPAAPAPPAFSLNSLLSDDWSPTPAAPQPSPSAPAPAPAPPELPAQSSGKTPPHKLAAEIASLVEGFKKDADPEPPKGKVSMAPSPGVKNSPNTVPIPPPQNQRGVELKPPNHPLQKPSGPGISQLINLFGGGKKEEAPKQQEAPSVAPPPPVPMRGKDGEKTKPAEKLSNALFTSEYLTTGDSATGKKIAEEAARIAADQAAQKVAEQTAKILREQEEDSARKAAEEEAVRKAAEEEAARRAAAEELARKTAEEAARKAAEEAARKAAEEEAARKAAEEEAARKAAEEAARKAAEEEAARKAAEEEAARKAAEEEAARKAAEEAARKAAEEEAARKAAEEEVARKSAEEAVRQAAEEAMRRAAENEAARKAAEEESARKAEEEAAAQKAAEEEAARKAAEEEAARLEAARSAEEAMRQIAEQAAIASKEDPAAALLNQQQQIARLTAEALSAFDPFQSKPLPDNVAAAALGAPELPNSPNIDSTQASTPAFDPFASDAPASMLPSEAAPLPPVSEVASDFSTPMLGDLAAQLQLSAETASPPPAIENPFTHDLGVNQSGPATLSAGNPFLPASDMPPGDPATAPPSLLQSLTAPQDPSSTVLPSADPQSASLAPAPAEGLYNPFAASLPRQPEPSSLENPFTPSTPAPSSIESAISQGLRNLFVAPPPTPSDSGVAEQPALSIENPFGSPSGPEQSPIVDPLAAQPSVDSLGQPASQAALTPMPSTPLPDSSIENPFASTLSPPVSEGQQAPLMDPLASLSSSPLVESSLGAEVADPVASTENPFAVSSLPPSAAPSPLSALSAFASGSSAGPLQQDQSIVSAPVIADLSTSLPDSPAISNMVDAESAPAPALADMDSQIPVPALAAGELPATPVAGPPPQEHPVSPTSDLPEVPTTPLPITTGTPNPFTANLVTSNSANAIPLAVPSAAPSPPPSLPPVVPSTSPIPSLSSSGSFMVGTPSGVMGREPTPAAVGGLVAKLEQQAQRANAKLEQKLDEIQGRLQRDLALTISKLAVKEQASLRNILSLKTVLSRRLVGTSEELKEQVAESVGSGFETISEISKSGATEIDSLNSTLSVEVLQQFDELSTTILALTGGFADKAQSQHESGLAALQEVLLLMHSRLEEVGRQHSLFLQKSYEQLELRANELSLHSDSELSSTYERLKAELATYRQESLNRLDTLSSHLLEAINESVALSLLNIQIHAEIRGSNVLLPRLLNYKQALSIKAEQLREKYKEEVEKLGLQKLAELKPAISAQRDQMEQAARDARQLKSTVEVGQREEFEKTYAALAKFVDEKIVEARGMAGFSADELGKIERSVSQLSDAATIESDAELAQARKQVLTKLQSIGVQLQTNVNDSLRGQIASMEDKGRMLQEELISSMEGNAYAVRKSSEASISRVRQALEIAYQQISELQNHYLQ